MLKEIVKLSNPSNLRLFTLLISKVPVIIFLFLGGGGHRGKGRKFVNLLA